MTTFSSHSRVSACFRLLPALALGLLGACTDSDDPSLDDAGDVDAEPAGTDGAPSADAPGTPDAPDAPADGTVETEPDSDVAEPLSCATSVPAGTSGTYIELCSFDGTVEHVRMAGVIAPATHASAQIFFGFDAEPSSPQAPLAADQFKLMLYGGGLPAPGPMVQPVFGAVAETVAGDVSFVHALATVCFDLHDSAADTAPRFVLWVDGQKGADCEDFSTLTAATAFGVHDQWGGATGAIAKEKKILFRQAAGLTATPVITLFDEPVLVD